MKPGDASYPKGRNPLEAEKPVVEHGTTVMVPKIVSYDDIAAKKIDEKMDKAKGIKEGSKADIKADRAIMKKFKK